jgi:hypothetical protein
MRTRKRSGGMSLFSSTERISPPQADRHAGPVNVGVDQRNALLWRKRTAVTRQSTALSALPETRYNLLHSLFQYVRGCGEPDFC